MDDLQIRLSVISAQLDTRLVPIIGSGLSNEILPDVAEMTRRFREAVPPAGLAKFDERIGPIMGTGLGYQNAAAHLGNQAGQAAVQRVIRSAVLDACVDASDIDKKAALDNEGLCRRLEQECEWKIPQAHVAFARYFARLPGTVQGPIITTNFDPFIELALRAEGVEAEAVPVFSDRVPTPEQLAEKTACQVVHMHGFWRSRSTLNSIPHLTRDRPALSGFIRNFLYNSVIIALGYGGWNDSFMSTLSRFMKEEDLYSTELCWASYEANPAEVLKNEVLKDLDGRPGFSLFLGVRAEKLFSVSNLEIDELEPEIAVISAPPGYLILPLPDIVNDYRSGIDFRDGGQPTWLDANSGAWPKLTATVALEEALGDVLEQGGGGGVVAIGPMGEGKTLAIMQVALEGGVKYHDWTFLWRDISAPPMTPEWMRDARIRYGQICICSDDADLVAPGIAQAAEQWDVPNSGVAFLLASQDRLWWPKASSIKFKIQDVIFHGLTEYDSENICDAWVSQGILEQRNLNESDAQLKDRYASMLFRSANSMDGASESTLLGAVLDVRAPHGLRTRVENLMEHLEKISASKSEDISMSDMFGAICLMQDSYDKHAQLGRGISRTVLAAIVDLKGSFNDSKILIILGREALVSFSADRVYCRHGAIARMVVEILRRRGRLPEICRLVGRAGGRLKAMGGIPQNLYRDAFLLGRELSVPDEIWKAAEGAMEAVPRLLQARVNFGAQVRRIDPDFVISLFNSIAAHLSHYNDVDECIRIFLNEYSISAREVGEYELSLGTALLGISDQFRYDLERTQASYALSSMVKTGLLLREQSPSRTGDIPEAAFVLLEGAVGKDEAARRCATGTMNAVVIESFRGELGGCVAELKSKVGAMAVSAGSKFEDGALSSSNLGLAQLIQIASESREV